VPLNSNQVKLLQAGVQPMADGSISSYARRRAVGPSLHRPRPQAAQMEFAKVGDRDRASGDVLP